MKISAIEIGTNSTKFIIAKINKENNFEVIHKSSIVNRLSRNMYDKNYICEDAIDCGVKIVGQYVQESNRTGARLVSIFSTSVLRDAGNRDVFIKKVKELYDSDVDVISGEREAYLAYKGCSTLIKKNNEKFAVIDIGGGSTEITIANKNRIDGKISLDIGAVRLTEMFISNDPVTDEETKKLIEYTNAILHKSGITYLNGINLVGTGGTIKTVGTILIKRDFRDEEAIHGMRINLDEIELIYSTIRQLNIEKRKNIIGLNPKRSDVIIQGVSILLTVMRNFGAKKITISSRGVLEGLIDEYLCSSF